MKPVHAFGFLCLVALLIVCAGCTSTTPPATQPPTPVPVATTIATPVPTPTPYPGALSLNQEAPFGIGGKNGTATVYKAGIQPNYSWTSPSFNSPREQAQAGNPLGTQQGYNTAEPADGNVFLFTWVRLTDTGDAGMVAPSPNQFVVNYNGKDYTYRSVQGSDVTIGSVTGTQYRLPDRHGRRSRVPPAGREQCGRRVPHLRSAGLDRSVEDSARNNARCPAPVGLAAGMNAGSVVTFFLEGRGIPPRPISMVTSSQTAYTNTVIRSHHQETIQIYTITRIHHERSHYESNLLCTS